MSILAYSFLNGSLLIGGVEITGFHEGDDVIEADRNVDSHSHIVGADGQMSLALNADRSGTITFRLKQDSPSNAYLSGLINDAESGINPIVSAQFLDTDNGDIAQGSQGYLLRPAKMTRGSAINLQEWQVVVENLFMFSGVAS